MSTFHQDILAQIKQHAGKPTQHTFMDSYLGNDHPRYPISMPVLRKIAREWMRAHKMLTSTEFSALLTSLIGGESSTEKVMAGFLLDYATAEQRKFNPKLLDQWLDHLIGWNEVDVICTGQYSAKEIPGDLERWKPLLVKLSKSKNVNKRRASLVLLCQSVGHSDNPAIAAMAIANIERLKHEKEVLITKAISWLLRSMVAHHAAEVRSYLEEHADSLPKIAVRETLVKLQTGKKQM